MALELRDLAAHFDAGILPELTLSVITGPYPGLHAAGPAPMPLDFGDSRPEPDDLDEILALRIASL
ncbi:MAG: hypothetical protein ACYDAY_09850 [Candidatus Dormibacteria bacterium]